MFHAACVGDGGFRGRPQSAIRPRVIREIGGGEKKEMEVDEGPGGGIQAGGWGDIVEDGLQMSGWEERLAAAMRGVPGQEEKANYMQETAGKVKAEYQEDIGGPGKDRD